MVKGNLTKVIKSFIDNEIYDLQEEGSLCLECCEEEGNFHMVSYWLDGTYSDVNEFLNENYSGELGDIILEMYPKNLSDLESKIRKIYGECTAKQMVYEALATIILVEMQYYPQWFTVYGTEEEDMIDFNKYHILNALSDEDEFPIIKSEDVVAAMYGINETVTPSDMYDVFAHYADDLKLKKGNTLFEDEKVEPIFTPDTFLVAGVVGRWKNYTDFIPKKNKKVDNCCTEYVMTFNNLIEIEDSNIRNTAIMLSIIEDYMNRFSEPPNSLPLLKNMIQAMYTGDSIRIQYCIRGVKGKKVCWDYIHNDKYNIPTSPEEYQDLILKIATDFKKELIGMEKEKYSDVPSYEGKYPNRESASHGLNFVKDINVKYKNKRGITEKKPSKPNYSLALAEKQATYFIKKMLRYSKVNPVLSTSFGIDSTITQHLIRRVAKHSYFVVNNDSLVEYPELSKFRKKIIREWGIEKRITITKPIQSYWFMQAKNGWNWEKKGARNVNQNGKKVSASEECCKYIKHIPMYNCIDKFIEEGNPIECIFTGLRAAESLVRLKQSKRDNVIYYAKSWKSIRVNPITFFTDEYVWDYVKKYNVPYCEVYDKILYYEDAFENVSEDEIGKILYKPRIGCWTCMITAGNNYLIWLKHFYLKQYEYLMIKKGMARELFEEGAKKLGIIADFNVVKENKNVNSQLSMFDNNDSGNEKAMTSEEILNKYSIEDMEKMIMKRPCKFLS